MNHLRLDTSQADRVTIWIDVAERSVNVLSEPVFDELFQCLDGARQQLAGRAVVVRSAKPKGFVVGADLRRILMIETEDQIQKFLLYGQNTLQHLEQFEGDTVAYIAGPCLGGGLELALACRYRIACDTSRTLLGMPEARLGLMPGWGGTQRLIETLGIPAGLHLLLGGEPVDAQDAFQIGLVDAVGSEPGCEDALSRFLQSLKEGQAGSVGQRRESVAQATALEQLEQWERTHREPFSPAEQAIIKAVATGVRGSREAGLRAERELFFPLLTSPEAREKLQRFAPPESRSDGRH